MSKNLKIFIRLFSSPSALWRYQIKRNRRSALWKCLILERIKIGWRYGEIISMLESSNCIDCWNDTQTTRSINFNRIRYFDIEFWHNREILLNNVPSQLEGPLIFFDMGMQRIVCCIPYASTLSARAGRSLIEWFLRTGSSGPEDVHSQTLVQQNNVRCGMSRSFFRKPSFSSTFSSYNSEIADCGTFNDNRGTIQSLHPHQERFDLFSTFWASKCNPS